MNNQDDILQNSLREDTQVVTFNFRPVPLNALPEVAGRDNAPPLPDEDLNDSGVKFFTRNSPDRWDYVLAASSGVLTAALDTALKDGKSLDDLRGQGSDAVNGVVKLIAKLSSGKDMDLRDSISYLEKEYRSPRDRLTPDFGGGLRHHVRDFSHHLSLTGLVFSLITQFTGTVYGTDTEGNIISRSVKDSELLGATPREKIFKGTIGWLLHLVSDMAGSSQNPGRGTGIPGPMLSALKTLSALPGVGKIKFRGESGDVTLSLLASKLFNGTLLKDGGNPVRFDFRTEVGISENYANSGFAVLLNESIVRAFYAVREVIFRLEDLDISGADALLRIDLDGILKKRTYRLTRMLTVSSGAFMAVSTVGGAIKAGFDPLKTVLNLNIAGVVSFAFNFANDLKMIKQRKRRVLMDFFSSYGDSLDSDGAMATEKNVIIFKSLLRQAVEYDIEKTSSARDLSLKTRWELGRFTSEDTVYGDGICRYIDSLAASGDLDKPVLYRDLLTIYLTNPYAQSGEERYENLKFDNGYVEHVFCEKQGVIDRRGFAKLLRNYRAAVSYISGKAGRTVISSLAAAAVAGGIGLAFAPGIAVAIAGPSLAGLHGAALTSASLAMMGGGSLAAGGLGMAGGTATIALGSSALGLAGSGRIVSVGNSVLFRDDEINSQTLALQISICQNLPRGSERSEYGVPVLKKLYRTIKDLIDKQEELYLNGTDKAELKDIKSHLDICEKAHKLLLRALEEKRE